MVVEKFLAESGPRSIKNFDVLLLLIGTLWVFNNGGIKLKSFNFKFSGDFFDAVVSIDSVFVIEETSTAVPGGFGTLPKTILFQKL